MTGKFPKVGQGNAKLATAEDLINDSHGYTNPNLHRRIDPHKPTDSRETKPRDYMVGIYSVDSIRTTTINCHDEESTISEIP